MNESVAVRGVVATDPRHLVTQSGVAITSFRLVSTRRRFNRETESWQDAERSWYTVSAFRRLALSAAGCLAKGDPVLVSGRLAIREWTGEQRGITAEIEADGIGHDLTWGTSTFTRSLRDAAQGDQPTDAAAAAAIPDVPEDSPAPGP